MSKLAFNARTFITSLEKLLDDAGKTGSIGEVRKSLDKIRQELNQFRDILSSGPAEFLTHSKPRAVHTILVVDDNEINLQVTCAILENRGFVVEKARTGAQAVTLATEKSFDCIFMDISMPDMDGFEATRRIKQHQGLQDVPIVALTAVDEGGIKERCRNAGMNYFLSKPVIKSFLLETIQKISIQGSREGFQPPDGESEDRG